MFNPIENDNYNEWVELYNPTNKTINLSGWSITDNKYEDFLEADLLNGNSKTEIAPHNYAIITDIGSKIYENLKIPSEVIKLQVDDSSIGNSLGNSGDKLILKNQQGKIIDCVEWIIDYEDIPGKPTDAYVEGYSIGRINEYDHNNSLIDFQYTTNLSPGYQNNFQKPRNLKIDLFPKFIPKISKNKDYSHPFAIKITISNHKINHNYELKAYIFGNNKSRFPASQTWNINSWIYSNNFINIKTDEKGSWSGWLFLRFNKDYKEYINNIKNNFSAFLKLKIKDEGYSKEISKKIYLLDMDNSTSNGSIGGYAIGFNQNHNGKIIIVENEVDEITGLYKIEDNGIDDSISIPGYYKVGSVIGNNLRIKFFDQDSQTFEIIRNIKIKQGEYVLEIITKNNKISLLKNETNLLPITIFNNGSFDDYINYEISLQTSNLESVLNKDFLYLKSKEKKVIFLELNPNKNNIFSNGKIKISAFSNNDIAVYETKEIDFEIKSCDLYLRNISFYSENKELSNIFFQGENIKIKVFLKNIGNQNATKVIVNFYFDKIDVNHFIGSKNYDLISKYQKYPSIIWDTSNIKSGNHKIIILVDEENINDELNKDNNFIFSYINLKDTSPSKNQRNLLITEFYYHTHPGLNNEYIVLHNPTKKKVDISNLYFTNNPLKNKEKQKKIIFPKNTILQANSSVILTQNSSAYVWETNFLPDFEYYTNSNEKIPQMNETKKFILSNKGGIIALKNKYNHTIDLISYGDINSNITGWNQSPIKSLGEGIIYKRNGLFDTNTSTDWNNNRRYQIGQSEHELTRFSIKANVKTFVSPDCSYNAIVNEIKNANESINLNMYELTNPSLCEEIIKSLRKGVNVNILLEGSPVGGISNEEKYIINRIASYGADIRFIINNPEKKIFSRYLFNHAKYLIIDNQTVIVESCNWASTGVPKNPTYGNREWGIIVKNQSFSIFYKKVFLQDWDLNRSDILNYKDINTTLSPNFYIEKSTYYGKYKPKFETKQINESIDITPIFSPDNSQIAIINLLKSAKESIYIQQLYIYKNWNGKTSPFVEILLNKSREGVKVKILLNNNPNYEQTNNRSSQTLKYLKENGIDIKFHYTNWSYFSNIHNKGVIVDNKTVLISSINWNENSVTRNRETGLIIENENISKYYSEVFFNDWNLKSPNLTIEQKKTEHYKESLDENTIYIMILFTLTFILIGRDWRKRQWH